MDYFHGIQRWRSNEVALYLTKLINFLSSQLYINGRQIENLKEEALELRHFSEYHGQPCNINPCLNGGVCVPALEKADCRCPRQYLGKNCERGM